MTRFLTMMFLIAPVACTQTTANFVEVELEDCVEPGSCPDPVAACVDDEDCESNFYCDTSGSCVAPDCGNGVLEPGESCDDGNTDNNDGCLAWCVVATCGDGVTRDGVEECDEGAENRDDGACLSDCTEATCGDGFVWIGMEACDDGNNVDSDGCSNVCTLADCGNGVVEGGEQCDDGNAINDDACLIGCIEATCGDGFTQTGVESCDLGAANTGSGACLLNCAMAVCGDGFTWIGVEECDDGNSTNNDGCNNDCTATVCGDGVVDAPYEDCDDANSVNGDGCDNNCTFSVCGNGIVAGTEQCDDGNLSNNDACLDTCVPATCGDAYVWAGQEECDEGTNNSNTGDCLVSCLAASCGDGNVWSGQEECDDANPVNGDGCDNNCTTTACGNGIITAPEECDDGINNSNGSTCLASCVVAICGDGFVLQGVEECDDGNSDPNDGCDNSCMINLCGNGMLDPGEGCEPTVPGWTTPPNALCVDCMLECVPGSDDCNGDPGDGCEAVVANDPQNCGACGHDCGPGSCFASRCQPFTVGTTSATHFVTDGAYVYYHDSGVRRRLSDGSGTEQVLLSTGTTLPGDSRVFGVDNQYVYLHFNGVSSCTNSGQCLFGGTCNTVFGPSACQYDDALLRVSKNGGGSVSVIASGGLEILSNALLDEAEAKIYFVATVNGVSLLQEVATDGGSMTAISAPPPQNYAFGFIAMSQNHIYWSKLNVLSIFGGGDLILERVEKGTTSPESIYTHPYQLTYAMVHGGDGNLYLGQNDLLQVPESGGSHQLTFSGTLSSGGTSAFRRLVAIEDRLFAWRNTGELVEVYRNTPATLSGQITSGPNLRSLTGDGADMLYFLQGNGTVGQIRGIRLPPPQP